MRISGVILTGLVAVLAGILAFAGFTLSGNRELTLVALQGPLPALDLVFGLTGIAAPFLAIVAVLGSIVALWQVRRGRAVDAMLTAIFTAAMLLVVCSRSVALFFIAWEAMSLSSAFLVAAHHERRFVRRTTFVYLLVAQGGALCILAALLLLAVYAGSSAFGDIAARAAVLPPGARNAAFVLALAGFGSKAGLIPLHFWLPRAHPVAPAGASALLSGAMLKVALYGLLIVSIQLAAPAPATWGFALVVAGTISALGGILYAVIDRDLKRLLAYSSIENVGIVVLAFGIALIARALGDGFVATLALTAGLFHAFNHAIFKALLFLGAGIVNDAEGSVDLERLGGLRHQLVWTAPLVLIGCAAIAGIPAFNGFVSEWLIFRSAIALVAAGDTVTKLLVLAAIAGLALTGGLAAACFVKVFGVAFLGAPRRPALERRLEAPDVATAALAILAALCFVFGVAPMLAIGPIAHVVQAAVHSSSGLEPVLSALPALPAALVALPLLAGVLSLLIAARAGVRFVPAWTCGSPVTASAQYTATAFSKPIRRIFALLLVPDRSRRVETGASSWFPSRITYQTKSRYLIDDFARSLAALTLLAARRSRVVQSGSLRLYIAYAVAALVITVVAAR